MAATQQDAADDTVLRISNVSKFFGGFNAVDSVDLSVKRNELVTLLGPSGCGKTTTLRMIAGFEFPTQGEIFINDIDVTYLPPNKREIGIVFQSYSLFPHLKVSDNIAYGLKRRGVPKSERDERVKEVLALVDLEQFGNRLPSELSGGQQQRVALARAIVIRPKILLLDEPLSALDAKLREKMRFELRHLQRQIGMTTVMVTHDQEEALSMSDHIVVMNKGRIEQEGPPVKIYQQPKTAFVANFIGESNLLEGQFGSETDGLVSFKASCGLEMSVHATPATRGGQRALVSLRPENLRLTPIDAGRPATPTNSLRGRVVGVNYLGARTIYEINTMTRDLLVAAQNDTSSLTEDDGAIQEGEEVYVSWNAAASQVLEAR